MQSQSSIESRLKLPEKYRPERVLGSPGLVQGERRVIAQLEGPGCIRHFYCTNNSPDNDPKRISRSFILRIYWDGEESPSVEVPVNDFFGIHHDIRYYPINSYYVSVKDRGGMACYFPLPFAHSAKVEIEARSDSSFTYTLDWQKYLTDEFDEDLRFHSSWRRENPAPAWGDDFFVMDALGHGYLLGFSLGLRQRSDDQRWSHAGSENFYIDGEAIGEDRVVPHYLRAAGGENTFDVAFGGVIHRPETHLYAGIPYYEHQDSGTPMARHALSAYKLYVHDPLPFEKSLHFRWGSQANDMCMTSYWYQAEPHRYFVKMPSWEDLDYGRWGNEVELSRGKYDLLTQIGAQGPTSFSAGSDDGTWWLYSGEEILGIGPDALRPGIVHHSFHGFIDFSHVFNVRSTGSNITWPANASAATILQVQTDTTATLHLSWEQGMKVRLNDDDIQSIGNNTIYKYQAIEVNLRRGNNQLLVNLDNPDKGLTWGAWTFSCRVVLPDGEVVIPRAH